MTNPVTQQLTEQLNDRRLNKFVDAFDVLEVLIIEVYKSKQASPADTKLYRKAKKQLQKHYQRYQKQLTPYWQQTTINNEPITDDPFLTLTSIDKAAGFIDNWAMMQTIPPARQALNEWLLDKTKEDGSS